MIEPTILCVEVSLGLESLNTIGVIEARGQFGAVEELILDQTGAELMVRLKPEEVRLALNVRFLDDILLCWQIALILDPQFPTSFFDPRNMGARLRSNLKDFLESSGPSMPPPSSP
ncbi:hypothetical protein Nepgr_004134 [Nepenthes gracilis]|uniref:Uncharacterized protein n=1 Tax=Nepenthes gracilis TaxID=150966 RepID=A0AAD3XEU6_NEPGR|nr:hypothetical protein Nepgr_004134 [Nepenthes gracilis]